jgi:hypothetical protein
MGAGYRAEGCRRAIDFLPGALPLRGVTRLYRISSDEEKVRTAVCGTPCATSMTLGLTPI